MDITSLKVYLTVMKDGRYPDMRYYIAHTLKNIMIVQTKNFTLFNTTSTLKHSNWDQSYKNIHQTNIFYL